MTRKIGAQTMRRWILGSLLAMAFGLPPANAASWIWVPDVSELQYLTNPDGRVYLRNLNQFQPSASGCCYNYYIDTTTVEGKNIFALILMKAAQGKGLQIGVPNSFAPGLVSTVGEF